MEKPRPGGKLNLNPNAARLTCVLVSLASMETQGSRLLRARRRWARAARAVSPAVSTPRFAARPSFTASASVSMTGPAGILSDGTLPSKSPPIWMELLTTFVPGVGPACCWVVTEPGARRPDSGNWAAGVERCAPEPPNWAQASEAASQARKIARLKRNTSFNLSYTYLHVYNVEGMRVDLS